jgi:pyrroloquinoline-quinone synthase
VTPVLSPDGLEAALRAIGAERYHDKHPFHHLLHSGKLRKGQVQAWALNRFCYQAAVPRKDAALMSRTLDRDLRREWRHRIEDHDGGGAEEGGIERWLVLTTGLGLDRDYEETLLEAVASSLTELFAPKIHSERISGMLENYSFITDDVMQYFKRRLGQATQDADFALAYVKAHAKTAEQQTAVQDALRFKCNVLWAQLDALHSAYVAPGRIPPGAFVPEDHHAG